jgi:hypothetical protein
MKRFTSKVQSLGQKAAQIQQAIKSVPPKIAEIRESVAISAGQLQQLRADVQSSVADLRLDDPERIVQALKEINNNAAVFEEAGYFLSGADMELSPAQRVIVHLEKFEDVPHSTVRSLITAHQNQKTIHALLSSLLQAEAVADRVALSELSYRTLNVHLGPIPSVRLCWRAEEAEEEIPLTTVPVQPPALPLTTAAPTSAFNQTSFFESRGAPPTSLPSSSPASMAPVATQPTPVTESISQAPVARGLSGDWKQEAFERLKKNPHASKYHH